MNTEELKPATGYNFGLIGAGGYIAPRHMKAILDTGNQLVAALDPSDSVGILDSFSPDSSFFTEFERFERHAEKLKRQGDDKRLHFVSIASPNYLHDSHIRFALRIGADAICEKPLVLNPWNIDALAEVEQESGKRIYNVLQLRLHPSILALKKRISQSNNGEKWDITLTYITSRGRWYFTSWKGNQDKSGGIATNIGIHFFDVLMWLFGAVQHHEVHRSEPKTMAGYLELEKANVRWYLSVDKNDLPPKAVAGNNRTFRSLTINDEEIIFTDGFTDLHTLVYKDILAGRGYGLKDVRMAVDLAHQLRNANPLVLNRDNAHPFLNGVYSRHSSIPI